jgi:hypothetical protein
MNRASTVFGMASANPAIYETGLRPMYMYWNLFSGLNGDLQGSYLLSTFQRFSIDLSDGLREEWVGGHPLYMMQPFDRSGLIPNLDSNPGDFIASRFTGNFQGSGFSIDTRLIPGMMGEGTGEIDYLNPLKMRLAIDDSLFGMADQVRYYILDSVGEIEIVDIKATGDPYNLVGTITNFTGAPVDIECLNAMLEYGHENNWLAVLQEVPDGFIVQIMEFDILSGLTTVVAASDVLPGVPMSLDVNDEDFTIHVLTKYDGIIEATRFEYVPY